MSMPRTAYNVSMAKIKHYQSYIMIRVLWPAAFVTVGLTAIAWLTQSLRFIDLIVNRGLGVGMFFYLASLIIPSLFMIIMPMALYIGVVFAYNRLAQDRELVIFSNAGLSHWQIMRPALMLAVATVGILYFISLYLLPTSYREFKDLQYFIRNNYASLLLQEGVFNNPVRGVTVYLRSRDSDGTLTGLLVHDNREANRSVTMMAQRGQLLQGPNGPRFILMEGNRQEVDTTTHQLSILHFDRYTVDISMFQETGAIRWREPEERFIHELFWPRDTEPHLLPKLRAEGHHRLLWPINSLILTLFALLPFIQGEFNRRGLWKRILVSTVFASVYTGLYIVLSNTQTKSIYMTYALYGYVASALVLLVTFASQPAETGNQLQRSLSSWLRRYFSP